MIFYYIDKENHLIKGISQKGHSFQENQYMKNIIQCMIMILLISPQYCSCVPFTCLLTNPFHGDYCDKILLFIPKVLLYFSNGS